MRQRAELDRDEWELIQFLLTARSGMRCEARTPLCIGGLRGSLEGVPRDRISLHHRRGRKMGGTTRAEIHSLANLLLVCGHGTAYCHEWIGDNPDEAEARGLVVPEGVVNPENVPLVLHGGLRVLLDPKNPAYLPPADGLAYAV